VNNDARVTGILRAAQLRSDGSAQVGSGPPTGVDLAVGGSIGSTGNISTTAALMANSLAPVSGSVVTATHDFTVEGTSRCDVFRGRVANQVTCQDNLTVTGSLVCQGGLVSSQGMAAQSILCQTDFTVLGNINGWTPLFCAGRVNGIPPGSGGTSIGRVGYTVWRPGTNPIGVYEIRFASPAPNNNYVVTLTNARRRLPLQRHAVKS
jgi:hypothetical protein